MFELPFHRYLTFVLAVCAFGTATVLLLALSPSVSSIDFGWRKSLVGTIFAAICILGILAALVPRTCCAAISHYGTGKHGTMAQAEESLKGHHIDCGNFAHHTLHVGSNVVCAACLGLAMGAFIALGGTVAYFHLGISYIQNTDIQLFAGALGLAIGLVEFRFRGYLRAILNIAFVLGSFSILLGVDNLKGDVLIDLYWVSVSIVWVLGRIGLSQWDHWKTCQNCHRVCSQSARKALLSSPQSIDCAD